MVVEKGHQPVEWSECVQMDSLREYGMAVERDVLVVAQKGSLKGNG